MTKKERIRQFAVDKRVYIGSFFIPFFVMTVICVVCQVQPFGDRSLVIIDGLHQYMPFFSEYQEKLKTLDSFFYSWNGGLGYNFIALWSYYLSSPLNLILVFVPKTALNMAVSFLIVLKISLSGLTMASFLISRSQKHNWKVLIFSTAFAFSNYMIGYSWNVMWLDSIVMFPLILIGFDRLMNERDARMYCWTLALAMLGNFYIAFMICIFLALWFFLYSAPEYVKYKKEQNEEKRRIIAVVKKFFLWIKKGILFAFSSVLAAAMAAVCLIPAYLGIMNTASADSMELPAHEWFTNFWNLFVSHMAVTEPITNDNFDGNANLYVGILALLLVCLYVFGKQISLKDKIKRILIFALFWISFNETILNFIWHGFHDQYGIPNRFAFLYLFFILFTGFEALEKLPYMKARHVLLSVFTVILLFVLAVTKSDAQQGMICIALSFSLVVFYGCILFLYSFRKMKKKVCMALLTSVSLIETIAMAFYGFDENGQIDVPKFFSDTQVIREIKEDVEGEDLVRTSLISSKMLDEEIWHNLKCVTMFGSTANGSAVSMMDHLGFYTGANEYLYKGATPLTNLLLNVKYNIRREEDKNLNDFRFVKSYGTIDLLENPLDTFIGYGVEGNLEEWYYESVYPFRVQNEFVLYAYGSGEIFHEIPIPDPETNECQAERLNDGEYSFQNTSSQADNLTFYIPTIGGEDLYIHYDGSQVTNTIVKVGDEIRVCDKINSEIYHVGLIEPGDEVKVCLQLADDEKKSGVVRLSAADFDQDQFDWVADQMQEQAVHTQIWSSNMIRGNVTLSQDGMILFSIPYDKGWSVVVDGREQEPIAVADGLLAVEAKAGGHSLELRYTSPGFYEGMILTICGIGIYFFFCWMTVRKLKKRLEGNLQRKLRHKDENVL